MQAIRTTQQRATVELELDELLMLNNALNEVCNGVDIPAFETRLGFQREEMQTLLARINELIRLLKSDAVGHSS